MIPLANKTKPMALIIMLALTTIPLFAGIYLSDPGQSELFKGVRQRKADMMSAEELKAPDSPLVLIKDQSREVDGCRLVYKGIREGRILIDVYLLELDPGYAYGHNLTTAEAKAGFRMGDVRFTMVSAGRRRLALTAERVYGTH